MMGQEKCGPEEKQAFMSLLDQVRSLMAANGISEDGSDSEGEGKEDYLDPESLLASKEEKGESVADQASEGSEDLETTDSGAPMHDEKFDPKEAMDFFSKRPGMDRKPMKGIKVGMTEIQMTPKKRG
jgi:hypothetical protein